jgi:hypothetical protein
LHCNLQRGVAWLPRFRTGIEHPTQWPDLQRARLMRRRCSDVKAGEATNSRMEDRLERSNWRSKTKRATSLRGAYHNGWRRRSFAFKRKGKLGDPDKTPSFGTQPLSGSDDAAFQGRQDNDFEAPQATQSAVLFPFPD